MKTHCILSGIILLLGYLSAAYTTTIYPSSMASSPITSANYVNYIVVGEITGVSNSTYYINRIGALPTKPISVVVPPTGGIISAAPPPKIEALMG